MVVLRTNFASFWQRKLVTHFSQAQEHVLFSLPGMIYDRVKLVWSRSCTGGRGEVQTVKNNPEGRGLVGADEVVMSIAGAVAV